MDGLGLPLAFDWAALTNGIPYRGPLADRPQDPEDGQLAYFTDATSPEPAFYSSGHGAWVSTSLTTLVASNNNSSSAEYLNCDGWGVVGSATVGWEFDWDLICEEVHGIRQTQGNSCQFIVRSDGSNTLAGVAIGAAENQGHQAGLSVTFTAGSVLAFYVNTIASGRTGCFGRFRRKFA